MLHVGGGGGGLEEGGGVVDVDGFFVVFMWDNGFGV